MSDKVYEVLDRVREEMNTALVKAKENESVAKYLDKLEELMEQGQPYQQKVLDTIDQLKKAVVKALGPEMAEKLGLTDLKEEVKEEAKEEAAKKETAKKDDADSDKEE
mmetsp:Transcript_20584/g.33265  ORF Transcript_20584/g.33265 Transcript_20584/m.33265 type:complete len:108 (+) Transcript_20584:78-401(+)